MYDNQPFNSSAIDQSLFDLHLSNNEKIIIDDKAKNALDDIAVVGGLFFNKNPENYISSEYLGTPLAEEAMKFLLTTEDLLSDDITTIIESCEHLSQAGIPLRSSTKFHFYNILPPIRSDFLLSVDRDTAKSRPKAQALILSGVAKYGHIPSDFDYQDNGYDNREQIGDINNTSHLANSPLHRDPRVWEIASKRTNVPFVVIRGGVENEISTKHFDNKLYFDVAISSKSDLKFSYTTGSNDLGLVFLKSALDQYKDQLVPGTVFGDALLNCDVT